MKLRAWIACLVCKIAHGVLQCTRRGGTTLPGRLALMICPEVLSLVAGRFKVISVTGTNGKTTSSRMLEAGLREAGCKVFSNRSGANLRSGITTEVILHTRLSGKAKTQWAILECDEAASAQVFREIQPRIILVTNLFRDQLDRYGEIQHARDCILAGLRSAPDALVCLNADCPLTASMAGEIGNSVLYYGIDASAVENGASPVVLSDASHCLRCGEKYTYSYVTYAHLGGYRCPACGDRRRTADVAVKKILSQTRNGSRIALDLRGKGFYADLKLPTMYNIYNAAGAAAAMLSAGIGPELTVKAISGFTGAFGRMEEFALQQAAATMILVKNPTAFNQAIEYLRHVEGEFELVFGLNDYAADGRDVSWIWDADMERLCDMQQRVKRLVIFGSRYADMALRLKYAGFPEDKFVLIRGCDIKKVMKPVQDSQCPVYILPTYTAMLKLRKELVGKHGDEYWR